MTIVLCAALSVTYFDVTGAQRSRLLNDLRSIHIAEEELEDASTPSLRVRWFNEIHRLDPVFAIEGTDPVLLEQAVERLGMGLRDTAALYPRDERKLILTSLYPMAFLSDLSRTEALRLSARLEASLSTHVQYSIAAFRTITRYISDTMRIEHALRTAIPADAQYGSFGGTATRDSMMRAVRIARSDAVEQRMKIVHRLRCALYFSDTCISLEEARDNRIASVRAEISANEPGHAPIPFALAMIEAQNATEIYLPAALIDSHCAPAGSNQPLYLFQKLRHPDEGEGLTFTAADNLYLLDYNIRTTYLPPPYGPENPESDPAYHYNRWVKDQGIQYMYVNAGATYLCLDAGKDLMALNGMYASRAWLKEHTDEWESDNAQETPLLTYADVASHMEQLVRSDNDDKTSIAIDMFRQGSRRFDTIVQTVRYDNIFPQAFAKHGGHIPLDILLATRSNPSILFLTSNPSFVPRDPTFYATSERHPMEHFHRITYDTLLQQGKDRAWLERHIQDSLQFMTGDTESLYTPAVRQ